MSGALRIVIVEDDVEIQAGSCIDRAAVGETRIKRGTKIDNLVQIGHAVEIAGAPSVGIRALRADTARHGPRLEAAGRAMFHHWLAEAGVGT